MTTILVTGSGGIAGVNFVRALRASEQKYRIVGTDNNKYYINFPELDSSYLTPRHDDSSFTSRIAEIVNREKVDFVHPQPSSEAFVISKNRRKLNSKIYLPSYKVMKIGQDKLETYKVLYAKKVPVANTETVSSLKEIHSAFKRIGKKVWVRARHGAGGRLSLLCNSWKEAYSWVSLWVQKGNSIDEFIFQEYLPGRNIAWDSLWLNGKLITSYCRERLEYPLKHVSPSGITGTPSVSRTIHDERVNKIAMEAVLAISSNATGAFSVDLKEDTSGIPRVTEVDAGKFHTTMPLWGYIAYKHLKMPWYTNIADLYVRIGLGFKIQEKIPSYDLIPQGYYMIRNIDSGIILYREDGWKERVI
ncbi:MAG: ATP-grasp domain-containing protein [Candidatus Bathyarchaeia archaeon]